MLDEKWLLNRLQVKHHYVMYFHLREALTFWKIVLFHKNKRQKILFHLIRKNSCLALKSFVMTRISNNNSLHLKLPSLICHQFEYEILGYEPEIWIIIIKIRAKIFFERIWSMHKRSMKTVEDGWRWLKMLFNLDLFGSYSNFQCNFKSEKQ